ncbi:hypothetical protein ACW7BC_18220 [Azospirillum argentinense]
MSGDSIQSMGTRIFIGDSTVCTTLAQYEAQTWTELGEVLDFSEFGETNDLQSYKTLRGKTRKRKGATNYGDPTISMKRVAGDAGQAALKAARRDNSRAYNFKILHDDAPEGGTGSGHYMYAFVMSYTTGIGSSDNPAVDAKAQLAIDAEPIEFEADGP